MARRKECTVFVLDVGPRMHPHLEFAARAAADYVTSKMLQKPSHEVALVLYGTDVTRNSVHDEMVAQGDPWQYQHIVEQHGMAPPDRAYLETLYNLLPGTGNSDFIDALAVALTVLGSAGAERGTKRTIILLSNLCSRAAEDPDNAVLDGLIRRMQEWSVGLEVLCLDVPDEDEIYEEDKTANLNQLAHLCAEVEHHQRSFHAAVDLAGAFKYHEYASQAQYVGSLSIGSSLHIGVKVTGKARQEKMPSPGKETADQEELEGEALRGVTISREYHWVDDPEHVVPETEVLPAYRYGANLVPYPAESKPDFELPVEKGMKLVGFVPADSIPRHHFMAHVDCLVADKGRESSCLALAALVQAMCAQGQAAIVRYVPKARSKPALFVAHPVAATASAPAHLLLNLLPFMEDIRSYWFSSFDKPAWQPSGSQLDAARNLVASMSLGGGDLGPELLQPEATPCPALHRLNYELGRRVVHGQVELRTEDPLAKRVLEPRLSDMPGAESALEAAKLAFPMGQAAKASRRGKKRVVGIDKPAEDFEAALSEGDVDAAISGLATAIFDLAMGGFGESKFDEALDLVHRLRQSCVEHQQPKPFNDMLLKLHRQCKDKDPTKRTFWQRLQRQEVKPIHACEAAGSQLLDSSQADLWFTQHTV